MTIDLSTWLTQTPTLRTVALVDGVIKTEIDFFEDVERFRVSFAKNKTSRVALFCEDSYRFACALFAAWCNECVTVLPTDMTQRTQMRLRTNVDAFVFDAHMTSDFCLIEPSAENIELKPQAPLELKASLVELFTSGSTGEPVQIPKRLEQVLEGVDHLDAYFADVAPAHAVVFGTVSHQHIYGFLWRVLWPMASERIITNRRLFYPETIKEALAETPDCILISGPTHLKSLPQDLAWEAARENVKMLVTSGGPLSVEALHICDRIFHRTPYEIFGSTELDGVAWRHRQINTEGTIEEKSTLWHVMPDVWVQAGDNDVLQVKSYRLEKNEWTEGGDRIRILDDKHFELIGRVDTLVKIAEKRVSLTGIEKELTADEHIEQARAIVLDDRIAVVAVPSAEGRALLKEKGKRALIKVLRARLRLCLDAVAMPHRWRFEPMLPADIRGKCTMQALTELFDARHIQPMAWDMASQTMSLTFKADPKLPYFKGHFPQFTLLPGIAQVELVLREANRYLKTPLAASDVKNAKFNNMILPCAFVTMTVEYEPSTNRLKYRLCHANDLELVFSSGIVVF